MRIAQVAPLLESVPPQRYGGTERIVSYLTEALVRENHDVTLFASHDSRTSARLIACVPRNLGVGWDSPRAHACHKRMFERVQSMHERFDVVHFHTDAWHFPYVDAIEGKTLSTFHNRPDIHDAARLICAFPNMRMISISGAQQRLATWAKWYGTVHHGIPVRDYPFRQTGRKYLVFVGRISPGKGVMDAIEIARISGKPLLIAARIDRQHPGYYRRFQNLLRRSSHVEFLGELNEMEKRALLADALALLFPISWPEPFGLVMPEAMATGTPVIAYRYASVPEVIDEGITGFIVENTAEAAVAVEQIADLDRCRIRELAEKRFSAERMAHDYLLLYQRMAKEETREGTREVLRDHRFLKEAS